MLHLHASAGPGPPNELEADACGGVLRAGIEFKNVPAFVLVFAKDFHDIRLLPEVQLAEVRDGEPPHHDGGGKSNIC